MADWKDLNPRLGAAYDPFGKGKTVLKASLARGVITEAVTSNGILLLTNPEESLVFNTTRSWVDTSGTYNPLNDVPKGAPSPFLSGAASGGVGAIAAANFYNQSNAANVTYANDVTHGWQNRPNEWTMSASVQQEVVPGIALTFGFYRTWFGNLTVAQNTAIPASGYDQYCVTPPASTAYSGIGGTPLCNLYDPQPQYQGKATYQVQKAKNFSCSRGNNALGCGNESDVYTGIEATVNARWHRLFLQGGVTAGHEVTNYCVEVNSPQDLHWVSNPSPLSSSIIEFTDNNAASNPNTGSVQAKNDAVPCYINPPWYQNLELKMAAVYTLPWWSIKLSANEQNLSSIPLQATYSYKSTNVTFLPGAAPGHTTLNCFLHHLQGRSNSATNHISFRP